MHSLLFFFGSIMKRILIIDTSFPINSRTEKFRIGFSSIYDVAVLAWARVPVKRANTPNYFLFNRSAEPGARLKKIVLFPGFLCYGIKTLKESKPDIIFASHWDSLIVAIVLKVFRKDVKIIYDCLDIPTSKNRLVDRTLKALERTLIKLVDLTVFASRHFKSLYKAGLNSYVFENYPSKKVLSRDESGLIDEKQIEFFRKENIKIISWIGVVRYPAVIKRLISAAENLGCVVFIYGDGPSLKEIEGYVKKLEIENSVFFRGRYEQSDVKSIYEATDYVWAAYPTDNANAVYAISNKYFESSLFGKVPIFSACTKMAESLRESYQDNVIFVDESSEEKIESALRYALIKELKPASYEPEVFWENEMPGFLMEVNKLIDIKDDC